MSVIDDHISLNLNPLGSLFGKFSRKMADAKNDKKSHDVKIIRSDIYFTASYLGTHIYSFVKYLI